MPFVFTWLSEPDKLAPGSRTLQWTVVVSAANSFTGLCSYNDKGEVELALADKYEVSEMDFTYTFTMKDGLK